MPSVNQRKFADELAREAEEATEARNMVGLYQITNKVAGKPPSLDKHLNVNKHKNNITHRYVFS